MRKRVVSNHEGSPVMVDVTECDQCGRVWDERAAPRAGVEMRRIGVTNFGDQLGETRTFCDTTCAEAWLGTLNMMSERANPR